MVDDRQDEWSCVSLLTLSRSSLARVVRQLEADWGLVWCGLSFWCFLFEILSECKYAIQSFVSFYHDYVSNLKSFFCQNLSHTNLPLQTRTEYV